MQSYQIFFSINSVSAGENLMLEIIPILFTNQSAFHHIKVSNYFCSLNCNFHDLTFYKIVPKHQRDSQVLRQPFLSVVSAHFYYML